MEKKPQTFSRQNLRRINKSPYSDSDQGSSTNKCSFYYLSTGTCRQNQSKRCYPVIKATFCELRRPSAETTWACEGHWHTAAQRWIWTDVSWLEDSASSGTQNYFNCYKEGPEFNGKPFNMGLSCTSKCHLPSVEHREPRCVLNMITDADKFFFFSQKATRKPKTKTLRLFNQVLNPKSHLIFLLPTKCGLLFCKNHRLVWFYQYQIWEEWPFKCQDEKFLSEKIRVNSGVLRRRGADASDLFFPNSYLGWSAHHFTTKQY